MRNPNPMRVRDAHMHLLPGPGQMLATLAADPIAGLIDTAYMGRLGAASLAGTTRTSARPQRTTAEGAQLASSPNSLVLHACMHAPSIAVRSQHGQSTAVPACPPAGLALYPLA